MSTKIIAISLILIIGSLNGQNRNSNNITYWGGCGIGLSVNTQGTFLNSFQYSIGLRKNNISSKIVAINNVDSKFRKILLKSPWKYPPESIYTLSFKLGYTVLVKQYEVPDSRVGCKELNFTIYSGVSRYKSIIRGSTLIATGINQVQYNSIEENGIGLPVEFELDWRFNNYCGVSSSYFVELNRSQSLVGFQLNIIVGIF